MKRALMVCIGLVLGITGTTFAQEKTEPKRVEVEKRINELKAQLNLSEEQSEKVTQLYLERNKQLSATKMDKEKLSTMNREEKKAARTKYGEERKKANEKMKAALKEILNDGQMKKYQALETRKLERRHKMQGHEGAYSTKRGIQHNRGDK